jgi:hypothetical protein
MPHCKFAVSKTLNGLQRGAVDLNRMDEAARYRLAVTQDSAKAAYPNAAAFLCTSEAEVITQDVDQHSIRLDG